jgi:hypothetical protein
MEERMEERDLPRNAHLRQNHAKRPGQAHMGWHGAAWCATLGSFTQKSDFGSLTCGYA